MALILGSVLATVYALAACISFPLVDRVGRRKLFYIGTLGQSLSMFLMYGFLSPLELTLQPRLTLRLSTAWLASFRVGTARRSMAQSLACVQITRAASTRATVADVLNPAIPVPHLLWVHLARAALALSGRDQPAQDPHQRQRRLDDQQLAVELHGRHVHAAVPCLDRCGLLCVPPFRSKPGQTFD